MPKEEQWVMITYPTGNDEPEITFMSAYQSWEYISKKTKIIISKYKIAARPNNTSVLLLRETDCPKNNAGVLQNKVNNYKWNKKFEGIATECDFEFDSVKWTTIT